jgi:hypothetical protein
MPGRERFPATANLGPATDLRPRHSGKGPGMVLTAITPAVALAPMAHQQHRLDRVPRSRRRERQNARWWPPPSTMQPLRAADREPRVRSRVRRRSRRDSVRSRSAARPRDRRRVPGRCVPFGRRSRLRQKDSFGVPPGRDFGHFRRIPTKYATAIRRISTILSDRARVHCFCGGNPTARRSASAAGSASCLYASRNCCVSGNRCGSGPGTRSSRSH